MNLLESSCLSIVVIAVWAKTHSSMKRRSAFLAGPSVGFLLPVLRRVNTAVAFALMSMIKYAPVDSVEVRHEGVLLALLNTLLAISSALWFRSLMNRKQRRCMLISLSLLTSLIRSMVRGRGHTIKRGARRIVASSDVWLDQSIVLPWSLFSRK